jgi:hypothetical protein
MEYVAVALVSKARVGADYSARGVPPAMAVRKVGKRRKVSSPS